MSNLAQQISEALSMFARNGTEPALIGGLAVVAQKVWICSTRIGPLLAAYCAKHQNAKRPWAACVSSA